MADGRKNNKGTKGNKGGSKGYGQLEFIRVNANKALPEWWKEILKMLKGKDKELKKFAMAELNKIQIKMIPQDFKGDLSGNFTIKWEK